MPRKKVDNRIRVQIENGVTAGHRSLFVVVGEKARDQVRGRAQGTRDGRTCLS